ncbi:MAG TPA: polysaccharide deacetylase family protein [Thermomonospora sp.]|nr:polysaccharide deacetylase family protein [Thermomonospora sp.]
MKHRPARMPLILMYHSVDRVAEDPFRLTVRPELFERQMDWLRRNGLRGVAVRELLRARRAGRARGLVGLTFDDGYADFATRAAPVLLRRGFTATVFVVAGEIGGDNAWDDGPRRALMTEEQIRCVAAKGMEIASHGLRHVPLPDAEPEDLETELTRSRSILADLAGEPVTGFAYPYGRVTRREADAVRKIGYDYACAIWRAPFSGDHALARTYVGDRDRALRLRAKVVRHQLRWRTRI